MWKSNGEQLQMAEGDFGIQLPITISGPTFVEQDSIKIIIKTELNGETIIEKTYSNITSNTIRFELTAAESELLPVGQYVYSLDWYQNGVFLCNIILCAAFKVVDKA